MGKIEEENAILVKLTAMEAKVDARLTEITRAQDKMFYGLLGVIAAMVGVKFLGTDPFLYAATIVGLVGATLSVGAILEARRAHDNGLKITSTGKWLTAFLIVSVAVQLASFLRDLDSSISPRVVYIVRLVMSITMVGLAFCLMSNTKLVQPGKQPKNPKRQFGE